jgi:hypothetical protein
MMDDYLDGLLDELVTAKPRERWNDVLGRSRRARRRYTAVVAAVGALVLVPAAWAAVNAFEGTPAPQAIEQNFVRWNAGAVQLEQFSAQAGAGKHVPRVDASKAHGVLQLSTNDGALDLWAAPESDGSGTCWFVGWESEMAAGTAHGIETCSQAEEPAIDPSTYGEAAHPSYNVLDGYATGDEATADVTLTNGQTTTLPVVEHLFLGALPPGSELASITGRDASGNVVATWTPPN